MTSKYQNSIEELEKGCGEIEIGRSPCSEGNLCDDCIIKLEGLKLGRKLTLEEELRFLESFNMTKIKNELLSVAEYLDERILKLKEELRE